MTYYLRDLGATMNREAINNTYEPTKGQYDSSVMKTETDYVKALESKANALGLPPVKIILSLWSPPAWMKQNNSTSGTDSSTNRLIDSDQNRQDFTDFIVHYVNDFQTLSGVYPYAISLQNEPELALSYDSCYYTGPDLAKLMAVVGPGLKQAGIPSKIFYPEDVSNPGMLSSYLSSAEQNTAARPYFNTFAVHGYSSNGVDPNADTDTFWKNLYNTSAPYNLSNWMTETSGYDTTTWSAALQLGRDMYSALKYGHLSAWVWWLNSDSDDEKEGLLNKDNQSPTMRSAVSEQYYHFIRPGAVMVDSSSNDPNVLSVAFNDSANHTMTTVLLNTSTSDKTLNLNFQGTNIPTQFTAYRTSATEQVVSAGTVTNSVTLPANSITTLSGTFSGDDAQAAPTIATQPQSQTVSAGQQVNLSVQAAGSAPFTYQWQRNGTNIDNAVGPIYNFVSSSGDDGATYTVTVKNAYGQVTSQAAKITLGSFTGALATQTTSPVTIDGQGSDAVWGSAPSYTLTKTEGSPQNGFAGSFQTAWDTNNLYVLVKVNDSNYTNNSDGVEIYVDGKNDKATTYDANDWQIALDQGSYKMSIYQNGKQVNPATFPSYAQGDGTGNYTQEVAIPWSILGQSAAKGNLVGLDVAIVQGSTNSKIFWNADSNNDWDNPSLFGTAQLSDSGSGSGGTPTPTPTPATTPTPTPTPGNTPTLATGNLPLRSLLHLAMQEYRPRQAAGSASYANNVFSVSGSGSDIGGNADDFQFVYQSLNGDGTIVARVPVKIRLMVMPGGVMIREKLQTDSAFDLVALTACCGSVTEARSSTGGSSSWNPINSGNVPSWVKLVRSGNTFTTYTSSDGSNWSQVDTQTITMANNVYIGLAVTSHSDGLLENSTFDNVSVTH
ncbi:sugar-binding protein [Dictyobacter kobayashii]|uniref:Ig-like domain-containing protein n=1 Tax=Dictyobacter kobayashii TaxID=2014872 RepID=A0A402AW78_9CHLR|nr:sugar-binding protein [Dictyobacter kobayashii]GCE23339.1 hypothetical protein KDK_71390 [Dictyobacter kobayashii]